MKEMDAELKEFEVLSAESTDNNSNSPPDGIEHLELQEAEVDDIDNS